jgi:hypothetical protein
VEYRGCAPLDKGYGECPKIAISSLARHVFRVGRVLSDTLDREPTGAQPNRNKGDTIREEIETMLNKAETLRVRTDFLSVMMIDRSS